MQLRQAESVLVSDAIVDLQSPAAPKFVGGGRSYLGSIYVHKEERTARIAQVRRALD
jgi:hypothetical protein